MGTSPGPALGPFFWLVASCSLQPAAPSPPDGHTVTEPHAGIASSPWHPIRLTAGFTSLTRLIRRRKYHQLVDKTFRSYGHHSIFHALPRAEGLILEVGHSASSGACSPRSWVLAASLRVARVPATPSISLGNHWIARTIDFS